METAARLRAEGRFADSLAYLERAAALAPKDPAIHADLGSSLIACHRAEEALESLERALALDPDIAFAHYHLGLALVSLGREGQALGAFEKASALAPRMALAHRRRGALLHGLGLTRRAAAAFRAAAAVAENPAQRLRDNARALRIEGRDEEAKGVLLEAKSLNPKDGETLEVLGRLYAEEGRFAEAEKEFRAVLEYSPGNASAAFQLFQAVTAREEDRPLLLRLAARARRLELPAQSRMLFHFALGRAYEQLKEYASAIRHFDEANKIRAAIAPLNRRALERETRATMAAFPPGSLPAGRKAEDERAILILGLPRSGTTLTEQILSSHPLVAAGGEIGFWSEHGKRALEAGATAAVLAPLAVQYRALLERIDPKAARVTDKNPFNFYRVGLLRRALPGARIIHVRRSPIDNALSLYTTYLNPRSTFFLGNREDLLFFYDNYLRLMDHWRSVLPPERFMEIDYEALVRDRERETRRLVEFCGLSWDEACLYPEKNTRAIDTASLWQARQPVYTSSLERWRNYAPWLGALLRLAPQQGEAVGGAHRPDREARHAPAKDAKGAS